MENNNNVEKKQTDRLIKILILLMLTLILLVGCVIGYFLVFKPTVDKQVKGGQREAAALEGSIQRMSEEEIQAALNQVVEEGMFRISIASNILMTEDGSAEVRIENNPTNRYVMQVTIYRDDNGKAIYTSDLIDPGYFIQSTPLDEKVESGVHDCTAVFTALYADTEEIVGTVGAQVKLHVFPKGTALPEVETEAP